MDQRIFYSLLERVGGNGRYQTVALRVWSILMMIMGSTSFFLPFMFYQGEYQCPTNSTNCKEYVCALPASERVKFVHDDLFSLASKFGDYRCEGNVGLDKLQSFIYLGGAIGSIIGALINELITKRKLMILSVIGNIAGLGMALLGQTLITSSVGFFINFAFCAIQLQILQCFIIETVSEDVRGQHLIVTNIFYGLGVTLNGLFFYLLKNGLTYIIILIPALVIILLFLVFYIEETPFDLIINFTPQDSLAVLKKIGLANNRQNEHKITLPELENVKREFQENEEKKQHSNISILDLFRYKSLRLMTILGLVLHYVTSFQFISPELSLRNYSLSIYTNGIVIGFAQLAGSIACYFIIDLYQRKKVIYISQAICFVIAAPIFFFFSCLDKNCSMATQVIQTIGLTFFRFGATITYNYFYMMQYQAFPNQIRGLALQVTSITAYLSGVSLPPIIQLCEDTGISIVLTFALCCIITVLAVMLLDQTFGIPPPEIIEELKYEHHQIDPNMQEKIKET